MNARTVARDRRLSRGARLCRQLISQARPARDGRRYLGRCRLASLLGCSTRTVSRYTAELRRTGALVEVKRPRAEHVGDGRFTSHDSRRMRMVLSTDLAIYGRTAGAGAWEA